MANPSDIPSFDPEAMGRALKKTGRAASWLVFAGVVLVLLLGSIGPYTDWQWYAHDLRNVQVARISYQWQGLLFTLVFFISLGWYALNFRISARQTLIYDPEPLSPAQAPAAMILRTTERMAPKVRRVLGVILALTTASSFAVAWPKLLMFINGVDFGRKDPAFGLDLGFFVFRLPWYEELVAVLLWLVGSAWVLSLATYELFRLLAAAANSTSAAPQRHRHIYSLGGLFLLLMAVRTQIGIWSLVYLPGTQFTGAGKAVWTTFGTRQFMVALLVGGAIAAFVMGQSRRKISNHWMLPAGLIILWLVIVDGTATVTQKFMVDPNRLNAESPFAERAIKMTQFGYGLTPQDLSEQNVQAAMRPDSATVAASGPTLENMRLWDPEVMRQAFDQLQSLRSYYRFHDVDVDRYPVGGKETLVMLSPRDIHVDGLPANAQNWTNTRLRYTHGYGVAVARVDSATSEGEPSMLIDGIPLIQKDIQITRPQTYFSDFRDQAGYPTDEPVIVDTDEAELDYESAGGSTTHRWTGDRGIPIGGFLAKLAFAIKMRDGNLLVSSNIKPESRLLIHRNISERAAKAFPYLQFDTDPYLVINEGKTVWILDAYVTTDRMPYSATLDGPNTSINYIRNAAKVTVDAYTGEITAYATNLAEPITATYANIYRDTFKPLSEMPAGLRKHLRYPEDMLRAQSAIMLQYHVTDPRAFLSNSEGWQVANEVGKGGITQPIRPFYVIIALPGEATAKFTLILPFTPSGKPNMSGWMAARMSETGESDLKLFRFKGPLPPGPELMESKFASNPDISNINRQFNNDQSEIVVGNSLVIPLGNSFMYAESLFLKSRTAGIQVTPRLTKVILAVADRIVVKDTYREALAALFAGGMPTDVTPTKPNQPTGQPKTGVSPAEVKEAADLFDQADAALKNGDFAKYGELRKQLGQKLKELASRP